MLVDTSVLARTLQPHHPMYAVADAAIERLLGQGRELYIVPQNLIELWVVATRPVAQHGLGMAPAAMGVELARIKSMFVLLPDTAAVYSAWEQLVVQHNVPGKTAHDAHLVAAMRVHGVTSVLTFDPDGFSRYPEIEVVHPVELIAPTA
jgi:predicted nucleic acid-binding protein